MAVGVSLVFPDTNANRTKRSPTSALVDTPGFEVANVPTAALLVLYPGGGGGEGEGELEAEDEGDIDELGLSDDDGDSLGEGLTLGLSEGDGLRDGEPTIATPPPKSSATVSVFPAIVSSWRPICPASP